MPLKIKLNSFSYLKSGIPADYSGNGGGFVFDCRFMDNPGKQEEFKQLTGKDKEVIEYLESNEEVIAFIENVTAIIDTAVKKYTDRGFTNLMISFGCTGGQHRSVYSAEKLKKHINKKFPDTEVELKHMQIDNDSTC